LQNNTIGNENTAVGENALQSNTIGFNNTAIGYNSLTSLDNTNSGDGCNNTAVGHNTLAIDTLGTNNTAVGSGALKNNNSTDGISTGVNNTAIGGGAMNKNTIGSENTALGGGAMDANLSGNYNVAIGVGSLALNQSGNNNSALGTFAGNNNFLFGSNNSFLGYNSGVQDSTKTYNNSTAIGSGAMITDSNQIVLGGIGVENTNIPYGRLNIGNNNLWIDADGIHFPDGSFLSTASTSNPIPVCYLKGTLILTKNGFCPIENLRIGDEIITRYKINQNKYVEREQHKTDKIRWISHFRCKRLDKESRPICFKKDCFRENIPFRDLYLSPDHGFIMNGQFIRAKNAINNKTIYQDETINHVTYYHLELSSHISIYANGMLAESYLDCGNRDMFEPQPRMISKKQTIRKQTENFKSIRKNLLFT
jgi:hypothetical protein